MLELKNCLVIQILLSLAPVYTQYTKEYNLSTPGKRAQEWKHIIPTMKQFQWFLVCFWVQLKTYMTRNLPTWGRASLKMNLHAISSLSSISNLADLILSNGCPGSLEQPVSESGKCPQSWANSRQCNAILDRSLIASKLDGVLYLWKTQGLIVGIIPCMKFWCSVSFSSNCKLLWIWK